VRANLARATHAPELVLIYESGTIGAKPAQLPLSIGDGILAETADAVVSVPRFHYWLQPGVSTSASSAPPRSTSSATLIPPRRRRYRHPKVRLPGAGGAPRLPLVP